jgi:coenzyme F420-reducing hydrogenase delta subunit
LLGCLKKVFVARLEKGIENSLKEMENGKKQLKNVRATEKEKISKTIDILEKEIRKLGKYVKLFSDI